MPFTCTRLSHFVQRFDHMPAIAVRGRCKRCVDRRLPTVAERNRQRTRGQLDRPGKDQLTKCAIPDVQDQGFIW